MRLVRVVPRFARARGSEAGKGAAWVGGWGIGRGLGELGWQLPTCASVSPSVFTQVPCTA